MMERSLRPLAILVAAIGLLALGAGSASAGVNGREAAQRHRIYAGVQDGSLTRAEAGHLIRQQGRTERLERRFRRNDGTLGPRERLVLDRRLDHSRNRIFRARHN